MGGYGSGRRRVKSGKRTTKEYRSLDVRELKRCGLIFEGQKQVENVASLQWTSCNFDGSRPWFVCPGDDCGRRTAILYFIDATLRCRSCGDLAYASQHEDELGRARRREKKARARFIEPGEEFVAKPKGMHNKTFVRLGRAYLKARAERQELAIEKSAMLRRSLGMPPL